MDFTYRVCLPYKGNIKALICALESLKRELLLQPSWIMKMQLGHGVSPALVFSGTDVGEYQDLKPTFIMRDQKVFIALPEIVSSRELAISFDSLNQWLFKIQHQQGIPIDTNLTIESSTICCSISLPASDTLPPVKFPAMPIQIAERNRDHEKEIVPSSDSDCLLLVDASNLLARGFFASSYGKLDEDLMQTRDGVYTNGIKIFFQKLFLMQKEKAATHMAICWDVKREKSIRRSWYPEYKGTRPPTPEPLKQQFGTLKELLTRVEGISQFTVEPYEADDIMGTLARRWSQEKGKPCYIYSNDRDMFQILDTSTSQILTKKDMGEITFSFADFQKEYGLEKAEQWIDCKSLLGDKGDNIPGVSGVGGKAVYPLIQMYGSIEQIYDQIITLDPTFKRYIKKLEAGRESAFFSKKLATIICNIDSLKTIPLDNLKYQINQYQIQKELERLELHSILKKIA
jgi:5'-3' exonuclease